MGFLDNTGLAYFYSKLKAKFVSSVNAMAPDTSGNVWINQVPLAENIISPEEQASIDQYIYRTSGGEASLESGTAHLVYVEGNMYADNRKPEKFTVTTTGSILFNKNNINTTAWRNEITNDGTYVFTYNVSLSNEGEDNWTSSGSWTYSSASVNLADYGLNTAISNIKNYFINCTVSGLGITAATVVPNTFNTKLNNTGTNNAGTYVFYYVEAEDTSGWYLNDVLINLNDYGIVATTSTLINGDSIIITWEPGTLNGSNVTIEYEAPVLGTLKVAKPVAFQSTGGNQFDKNTMYISNATIDHSTGKIVATQDNYYVCYCPAVGGMHGYAAVSLGRHIITGGGMGWCAEEPVLGSSVVTQSENITDAISDYSARFTASNDGYMVVVVSNKDDLMMGCAWSDYISDIEAKPVGERYIAYTPPSQIPIPMYSDQASGYMNLPTQAYGLPKIGSICDTIDYDKGIYIKRIERTTINNLATIQSYGVPYDYDDTYVYYVLDNIAGRDQVVYQLNTTGSYSSSNENAVTDIDFNSFIENGLPNILANDSVIHDKYTFTNTGTTTSWSYTWNDGANHTQTFIFNNDWGVTFGSPSSGDTLSIYIPIRSTYEVDDHGTEKFVGTELNVEAETLYGQNLRDKLRTDVLTISDQSPALSAHQKSQVLKNIGVSLQFHNVAVNTNAFASDSTYTDFPYKASVFSSVNDDIVDNMIPQIIFNVSDATSGVFAPVAAISSGQVYIYSRQIPTDTITIPTVICWRAPL